jgi:hypothetical protein
VRYLRFSRRWSWVICGWIPTFRWIVLPPSSGLKSVVKVLSLSLPRLLYFILFSSLSFPPCSFSSFRTFPDRPLFTVLPSYACYWLLPALRYTSHFYFSMPCSWHLTPTLPIGSHCNPPYPYSISYPTYIYVHFPFLRTSNPKMKAARSSETLIST